MFKKEALHLVIDIRVGIEIGVAVRVGITVRIGVGVRARDKFKVKVKGVVRPNQASFLLRLIFRYFNSACN